MRKSIAMCAWMTVMALGMSSVMWKSHTGMFTTASTEAQMYVPPFRGAPASRIGGGARGQCRASQEPGISLSVLTPVHTGFTVQDQPSLYWYLSQPVTDYAVEINLIDEKGVTPLFEIRLAPPVQAGVHRIRLADHHVRLSPGIHYRWSVALICDPNSRSLDIVSAGSIERVTLPESLKAQLERAARTDSPRLYAQAGMWYDAVQGFSELLEVAPHDAEARQQRATLLEEGHLPDVAAYDRQQR